MWSLPFHLSIYYILRYDNLKEMEVHELCKTLILEEVG